MDDPINSLRRLVETDFVGTPVADDDGQLTSLTYVRWWSSHHADVVVVYSPDESTAFRAAYIDPSAPHDMRHASIQWRRVGSVPDLVAELLRLPSPGGVPVAPRVVEYPFASKLWIP